MTNDYILLIANALLFISTFIYYHKKKRCLDLGSFVLLLWVIISIDAISLYGKPPGWAPYRELKIFPFIYFYLSLVIVSLPLLIFDYGNKERIEMPSGKRMNIISVVLIFIHIACLVYLWVSGMLSPSTMLDVESVIDNYVNSDENRTNIIIELVSWVRFLVPIFLVYNFTERKTLLTLGLIFCLLVSFISALCISSRLDIVRIVFSIPFVFFLFKGNMTAKQKRTVLRLLLFTFIFLGGALLTITLARFSDSRFDIFYYVEFYFSECILYFNGYGLDSGGIRYGDKTFPILKRFLGQDWIRGNDINSRYWNLDFDDTLFVSFIGEYTLDFGIIAILIFVLMSLVLVYLCRKKNGKYAFIQILLLSIPYQLLTIGFSVNPISERFLQIIFLIYIFLYIKAHPQPHKKNAILQV